MSLPILSVSQMREWEAATWATGQTEAAVIQRVGEVIARRVLFLTREGERILILAGKGHNGDDARAAIPHLSARDVQCLDVTDPAAQLTELHSALARQPALVVDALFGIGMNRPLDEAWQRFIHELNAAQLRVLSVDIPSGLNADKGETFGAAVTADITVTVGAPKQGLLRPPAWNSVGRLEVATDVGLIPCPVTQSELRWIQASDFKHFPPLRPAAAHKGDFGHLAFPAHWDPKLRIPRGQVVAAASIVSPKY